MRNVHRLLLLLFLAAGPFLHASPAFQTEDKCAAILSGGIQRQDDGIAAQLCSLIQAGRLEELRWPDCSSYRDLASQFYLSSDYALAWVPRGQPTPQARALIELFRAADAKGLNPEDYDASRWASRLELLSSPGMGAREQARLDFAFTVSALRYISDLARGRVSPRECQFELPAQSFNPGQFLKDEVLHAADVPAAVARAEPPFEGYRRTLLLLQRYTALAREPEEELPAIAKAVRPGDVYSGIAVLARRLRRLGDLPAGAELVSAQKYEQPLVDAVRKFQQRHGLQPDGVLGRTTLEQIAVPFSRRVAQIRIALERWRWIPRNLDASAIVVNLPEFRLRAFDNHRTMISMRAIVGGAIGHQTPIFADEMESIVFHPYWNVPESILRKEIVPRLRRDPGYIARHKMEVVNAREQVVSTGALDKSTLAQLASGKLRLRQQPGPANSLGLLKFVFPNRYGIYLHGTPERGLFFQSRRDFSHGCIRVEDPAALAAWLLRDRPEWTMERIVDTMSAKKPVVVPLRTRVPVLILYSTVVAEESGDGLFLQDIYGHDATLEKMLAMVRR